MHSFGFANKGTNDRIETGTIATAGENPYAHCDEPRHYADRTGAWLGTPHDQSRGSDS